MSDLLKKTRACVEYLSEKLPETGKHSGKIDDSRFREWREAVYDDLDFLYEGDFFAAYAECRGRDPRDMDEARTRACVTFLLRQMRSAYAPYPCLTSGELLGLLKRWIELKEAAK